MEEKAINSSRHSSTVKTYTQVNYSNLNIYRNVCQLRPMNVVAKVRFKLL